MSKDNYNDYREISNEYNINYNRVLWSDYNKYDHNYKFPIVFRSNFHNVKQW